jgi:hypothetical protein
VQELIPHRLSLILMFSMTMVACATPVERAAGLKPGEFVVLSCQGGKVFRARLSPEGDSVRVRTLHGSAELAAAGGGVFKGDGFELDARPAEGVSLMHNGKVDSSGCRAG